jgi:hypothetical protein
MVRGVQARSSPRGALSVLSAALALAGAVTCATLRSSETRPPVCASGLCATLIEGDAHHFVVDVTAPADARLHDAWIAPARGAPCRGGRSLNAVATDAGVQLSGPLPLGGTQRLALSFEVAFRMGASLDLDVRLPAGPVCLRLPLAPPPRPDVVPGDDGHGR